MSLFDQLVDQALRGNPALATLRVVVEKEILHHDILRVLSNTGLLTGLTFIGGTCLRACYGSNRLSEDLAFTGGADFTRNQLDHMAGILVESLQAKYGLTVKVAEPVREAGNVDIWKLRVQTRPERKDLPAQRINIDVCAIPSYEPQPMMLLNPYGVELGTSGLILQAQSREEIFADKLLAFALRPNRIKNRDLWDIAWLHQRQVAPALQFLKAKLKDHHAPESKFLRAFAHRIESIKSDPEIAKAFRQEMGRFLPQKLVRETVMSENFWPYLSGLMSSFQEQVTRELKGKPSAPLFPM